MLAFNVAELGEVRRSPDDGQRLGIEDRIESIDQGTNHSFLLPFIERPTLFSGSGAEFFRKSFWEFPG